MGVRDRLGDVGQWLASRPRLLVLKVDEENASCERRGIVVADQRSCAALEAGGRHFSKGFNAALRDTRAHRIAARIEQLDPALQGFAYEGAGMALTALDAIVPGKRRRFVTLLEGPGRRWEPLMCIGAGWAYARGGKIPQRPPSKLDPFLGWLSLDGAGFYEGWFEMERFVERREPPDLSGPAHRLFDQGVGRVLLFDLGGDLDLLRDTIAGFPAGRQPDLWSGVGVAATYAGGHTEERLRTIREMAGEHHLHLAQGCAVGVLARTWAGNVTPDAEAAARILCGVPLDEVARRVESVRAEVAIDSECPYEDWQARLRESFAAELAPL